MESVMVRAQAGEPIPLTGTILGEMVRAWRILIGAVIVGGIIGIVVGKMMPRWYETSVQIALVPTDDPTTPILTNTVDGAGAEMALMSAILHSRQVLDAAVAKLGLEQVYRASSEEEARGELSRHVTVNADKKSNTLTVVVEDRDPARARKLAHALGEAASEISNSLWTSRSRAHRLRLETRLGEVSSDLAAAEESLRAFREQHQVVDLAEQIKASVMEAAAVEHLRIEKKLALDFATGFGGADSPEVKRARRESRNTAAVLARLVHGNKPQGPLLPLDSLPDIETEHDRLKRAVEVAAESYQLLAKQVEQLRAVESRPTGRADVLDPPVQPRSPSRPARSIVAAEGGAAGLLTGALFALALGWRRRARTVPVH
jgi:uncharacterized protein involved in exopolysaccharide biosynthesis